METGVHPISLSQHARPIRSEVEGRIWRRNLALSLVELGIRRLSEVSEVISAEKVTLAPPPKAQDYFPKAANVTPNPKKAHSFPMKPVMGAAISPAFDMGPH